MSKQHITFSWVGDLDDDCSITIGHYLAHCECLGSFTCRYSDGDETNECWFVGVYHKLDVLFHSGEPGGMIVNGSMARAIAEAILTGHLCHSKTY